MYYLYKPPPPSDEYYYKEDSYAVNYQMRGFDRTPKAPVKIIGAKVKENKVGTLIILTARVIMSEMGITFAIKLQPG